MVCVHIVAFGAPEGNPDYHGLRWAGQLVQLVPFVGCYLLFFGAGLGVNGNCCEVSHTWTFTGKPMESIPSTLVTRDMFQNCGNGTWNPTQPRGINTGNRRLKPVRWKVALCCDFNAFSRKELATAHSSFMALIQLWYSILEIVSVILFFTQHYPTFPFDFFCCVCHVLYFAFSNPQMLWELPSFQVSASYGRLYDETNTWGPEKMWKHPLTSTFVNSRTVG